MNEAQVNETQADDGVDEETLASGNGDVDAEKLRRLRLTGFLRELVREEGRVEAAELLGVNHKTLTRAEESGEITGRMGDALERLLGTGDDPEVARLLGTGDDPEVARLRERVDALEERVAALEGGMETPPAADAEDEGERDRAEADGGDEAQSQERAAQGDGAVPPAAEAGAWGGHRRRGRGFALRRLDPEVYGDAWPLVEEWRSLRSDHPHQGKSLSWLGAEERLIVLELAMLDDHGLTLPPETQALRGFGRKGQTSWRRKALAGTRVALRKRELLRWVRRVLTVGLWRK